MQKLFIVGGLAPGKTREAALRHMRAVHGPIVFDPPPNADAMPSHYAQNPALDASGALPADWLAERDLFTEVGFDGIDNLKAANFTPDYLNDLRSDEPNFVDPPSVRAVLTRPQRSVGAEAGDPLRLFLLLKRHGAEEDFALFADQYSVERLKARDAAQAGS